MITFGTTSLLHSATKPALFLWKGLPRRSMAAKIKLANSTVETDFIYGTAWKNESTAKLVAQAIKAGFRGIDTACQPRHYREDLVGAGIRDALDGGIVERKELFVSPLSRDHYDDAHHYYVT